MREIVLESDASGKKLENFLRQEFPVGYVRKLFRKNGIRVNGQRGKPQATLRAGDKIQLFIPFERDGAHIAPMQELTIVHEDANLLVIDKPAGMAVHEGKTVSKQASVLGIMEQQYRHSQAKPQLVHRLDQDTSGLLLIAKNSKTAEELQQAFEPSARGAIDKEYLALVAGRLALNQGRIDTPLPGRQGRLVHALTRYWVVKRYPEVTLVRVAIETGRLHQIRLHFAQIGHPVVMDDQHGDFAFNKKFRRQFGLRRQFLHAGRLRVKWAGRRYEWRAEPPRDLSRTLDLLSKQNG